MAKELEKFLLESQGVEKYRKSTELTIGTGFIGVRQVGNDNKHHDVLLTAEQLVELINLCRGRVIGKLTGEVITNHALDQVKAGVAEISKELRPIVMDQEMFSGYLLNAFVEHCTNDGEFSEERSEQARQAWLQFSEGIRTFVSIALATVADQTPIEEEGDLS